MHAEVFDEIAVSKNKIFKHMEKEDRAGFVREAQVLRDRANEPIDKSIAEAREQIAKEEADAAAKANAEVTARAADRDSTTDSVKGGSESQ